MQAICSRLRNIRIFGVPLVLILLIGAAPLSPAAQKIAVTASIPSEFPDHGFDGMRCAIANEVALQRLSLHPTNTPADRAVDFPVGFTHLV